MSSNYTAKFPIYSLSYHAPTSTLILGGGGGPSRSGIPNGFLALRVIESGKGKSFKLEEIGELRTGDEAVMSLSLYDDKTDCLLVAGVNDRCWLLEFENHGGTSNSPSQTSRVSSIVKALNNGQSPKAPNSTAAPLNLLRTIQSDSSPNDDGYLRVTRFTEAGRSFLAAGSDGSVREWAVPEMRLLSKIETESEILDTDKNDKFLALVTSSGTIQLKSKDSDTLNLKPADSFVYKLVRFHKNFLLAVENFKPSPGAKKSKKHPRLVIFNLEQQQQSQQKAFKPSKWQSLPISKNCTCILPSLNSDHLAFGFADGSLLLLSLSNPSMAFLTKKEAHPVPVTGLAIDPVKQILLSSSADGQVLITQIPSKAVNISSASTILFAVVTVVISLLVLVLAILSRNYDFKLSEVDDFDSFYKLFPTEIEL